MRPRVMMTSVHVATSSKLNTESGMCLLSLRAASGDDSFDVSDTARPTRRIGRESREEDDVVYSISFIVTLNLKCL